MGTEQRIADRVPFRAPLRIVGRTSLITAESVDLSRSGLCIRLAVSALGGTLPGDDLRATAHALDRVLGRHFAVELNHEIVGSLVAKACRIVRIAAPGAGASSIELGCRFQEPLSSMETVVLGVPLPVERGSDEAWLPRADTPRPEVRHVAARPPEEATARAEPQQDPARPTPQADDPAPMRPIGLPDDADVDRVFERDVRIGRSEWRGTITGTVEHARPPLVGRAARVDARGVTLRIWRETDHAKDLFSSDDVVSATLAFAAAYGRELSLKVMSGANHIWTGPGVVTEIALPGDLPEDVFLSLRFARQLRPAELARLGLA